MALNLLPPELHLQIFTSLSGLGCANNLIRSSRTLHGIWEEHKGVIIRELLPHDRRISVQPGHSLYSEAQELAKVQQEADQVSEDHITTARRILSNSGAVNSFCTALCQKWTCNVFTCKISDVDWDGVVGGNPTLCLDCGLLPTCWWPYVKTLVRRGLYTLWRLKVLGKQPWGGGYKHNPVASRWVLWYIIHTFGTHGSGFPSIIGPADALGRNAGWCRPKEILVSLFKACRKLKKAVKAGQSARMLSAKVVRSKKRKT